MAKRRIQEDESEINMTPMLDIVFIMLIFFIVTATFVKEAGIDVLKPPAETGEKKPLANILIAVSPEGTIWVERREVELAGLKAVIEKLFAENPKGSISIQADEKAPAPVIIDIIERAREAGVYQVSVSTEPIS